MSVDRLLKLFPPLHGAQRSRTYASAYKKTCSLLQFTLDTLPITVTSTQNKATSLTYKFSTQPNSTRNQGHNNHTNCFILTVNTGLQNPPVMNRVTPALTQSTAIQHTVQSESTDDRSVTISMSLFTQSLHLLCAKRSWLLSPKRLTAATILIFATATHATRLQTLPAWSTRKPAETIDWAQCVYTALLFFAHWKPVSYKRERVGAGEREREGGEREREREREGGRERENLTLQPVLIERQVTALRSLFTHMCMQWSSYAQSTFRTKKPTADIYMQ